MGISYKPNVKDIQLSPAKIIKKLQKLGVAKYIFMIHFLIQQNFWIRNSEII